MELLMLPEGNNVYGTVTAPLGLEPVLRAMEHVVGGGRAHINRSRFEGVETLKLRLESACFHATSGVVTLPPTHTGVTALERVETLPPRRYASAGRLTPLVPGANFESERLDDGVRYLFNGGVGGSLKEVVSF